MINDYKVIICTSLYTQVSFGNCTFKFINCVFLSGMERVASITSSYYKYSEAAILVFALDNPDTFHILSQHLIDIVTYAENAKIFL